MAEVSFAKQGSATPVVDVQSEVTPAPAIPVVTQAVATIEARPVGYNIFTADADSVPGLDQIILPRINLVHFVGKLKNDFQPGSIVFNKRLVLFEPPTIEKGVITKAGTAPVRMTVLRIPKNPRYVEKVPGGGQGLIVNTEAEVRANGGTTNWNEWNQKQASGMKLFQILAEALIAIERPEHCEDDDSVFIYEAGGLKYALAIWGMKGSAYTRAAKAVFQTQRSLGCLCKGYPTWSFNVSTELATRNDSDYVVPVCMQHQKSSPEFLKFAAAVLGGDLTPSSVGGADPSDSD